MAPCDLYRMTTTAPLTIDTLKSGGGGVQGAKNVIMGRDAEDQSPPSLQPKDDHYSPSVRLLDIPKLQNGACGFNLSRSKWDPYPWASSLTLTHPKL